MKNGRARHVFIYRLLFYPVKLFVRLALGFRGESAPEVEGTYIVVSNHNTDWDPLLVGTSFRRHMYYVASEHVYRQGRVSSLLRWAIAPIARLKGTTDGGSAMAVLRALRRGSNVCLFAEGDRSWNGVTAPVHPSTGKLIKAARGSALVTYRIKGGYFTSPRWSLKMRRGRMSGSTVNVYTPEMLSKMSAEEIEAAINADIYEDAWLTQRADPVRYRGRGLAESLESALYICPSCGGVCTMASEGRIFRCTACGALTEYNEYGFFTGSARPFDSVKEWDMWQNKALAGIAGAAGAEPIFSDGAQTLRRITEHRTENVCTGDMALYRDRLAVGELAFPVECLARASIIRRRTIVFSCGGENYEIVMERGSARKYLTMAGILISAENGRGN